VTLLLRRVGESSRDAVGSVRMQVRCGVLLVRHASIVIAYGSCDVEKYLHSGHEFAAHSHYCKPLELICEYEGQEPIEFCDGMFRN
jgi:hypothetical protein